MAKDSTIKPVPIIIFSVLAMMNGLAAFVLGVITLLGSKLLFTADGYGPNRIAIADLFGVFAPQTGWIMLAIGMVFISVGYGLLAFKNLARLAVFYAFALLATATAIAVSWGIYQGEWGVVVGGVLKIAVEIAVCVYLSTSKVRKAFSV
jgi:hypothetical protein